MHVSMSHWEAPEITDDMYDTMQNHFMPMIKSLGATLVKAEAGPMVASVGI